MAAGHSVGVDPARWQAGLDELLGRVAGRFGRVEPRRRARAFVLGLLADRPRKNCWTLAEHAGDATPDGLQHLLAGPVWDHDAVRDDIRDYLVDHLGDSGAVLVVDEEVYGGSPTLRGWLETRQLPYVLAVKSTEPLPPASGPPVPAARLAEHVPSACWLRLSAGQGAKGRRWYGWSRLPLTAAGAPQGWGCWLRLRRSLRTGELAYHVCTGPTGLPAIRRTGCAGRGGDAGSRPALAPATTDGKPPSNHEGHDPVGVLVLQ